MKSLLFYILSYLIFNRIFFSLIFKCKNFIVRFYEVEITQLSLKYFFYFHSENQPLPPPLKVNCTTSAMALNGACYHFELEHAESWMDARNKCKQFDMDLVSIHSTIEIEHMVEFVIRNGLTRSFWIGLSRRKDLTDPIEKGIQLIICRISL